MIGFNAKCEDLKNKIVEDINEYNLPIVVIDYILQEISTAVKEKKIQVISEERRLQAVDDTNTQATLIRQEEKSDGNTDEKR